MKYSRCVGNMKKLGGRSPLCGALLNNEKENVGDLVVGVRREREKTFSNHIITFHV
jgi:hypothetical protein